MIKVFLDTNILIDYLSRREHFFESAALLMQLGQRRKCQLLIASLSFATASFILQAHYKMKREAIIKLFTMIVKLCHITTVDKQTIIKAITSDITDFEDALQHESALSEKADVIITRNKQDFLHSQIEVLTPTEFLAKYTQQT